MNTNNGTPYTDEEWAQWYQYKSNKELWIEEEEREKENQSEEE